MSRLGRGLDSLLSADSATTDDTAAQVAIELLSPGKFQPRSRFSKDELQTLADSVRQHGVIQPIIVRPRADDSWEIVAGERRWRAAKIAGLKKVPVIKRQLSDEETLFFSLVENIQRADLNPLEQAHGLKKLIIDLQITNEKAGDSVGLSRSAVSNLLRLLTLSQAVQEMLEDGRLEMGHARALLVLEKPLQAVLARKIVNDKLSVRATEALVKKQLSTGGKSDAQKTGDILVLERELSELLSAQVVIQHKKNGSGKISVDYGSLNTLEKIIKKLRI